jgi:hypothetical protein
MLEMKKLYSEGLIGTLNFADCSYYAAYREMWIPFCKHKFEWRNWMPQSYYSSHVDGLLMASVSPARPSLVWVDGRKRLRAVMADGRTTAHGHAR